MVGRPGADQRCRIRRSLGRDPVDVPSDGVRHCHVLGGADGRAPTARCCNYQQGLGLFPRRIGDRLQALSRCDCERNSLAVSDDIRRWLVSAPLEVAPDTWSSGQVGTCESPIEREGPAVPDTIYQPDEDHVAYTKHANTNRRSPARSQARRKMKQATNGAAS